MRKLSPEEFFELIDVMYDEDNNIVVFDMKGKNLAFTVKNYVISSDYNIVFNSENLTFFNTGPKFDKDFSMEEYNKMVEDAYYERMMQLNNAHVEQCKDCNV